MDIVKQKINIKGGSYAFQNISVFDSFKDGRGAHHLHRHLHRLRRGRRSCDRAARKDTDNRRHLRSYRRYRGPLLSLRHHNFGAHLLQGRIVKKVEQTPDAGRAFVFYRQKLLTIFYLCVNMCLVLFCEGAMLCHQDI